jgi:hypothetical protein
MLSDVDIREQLAFGKDADVQIQSPAKEDCEDCITPVGYDVRAGDTLFSYEGKEIKNFRNSEFEVLQATPYSSPRSRHSLYQKRLEDSRFHGLVRNSTASSWQPSAWIPAGRASY